MFTLCARYGYLPGEARGLTIAEAIRLARFKGPTFREGVRP